MNTLLDGQLTSANGSMKAKVGEPILVVPVFPVVTRTSNTEGIDRKFLPVQKGTTSGTNLVRVISTEAQVDTSTEATRVAINELRKLSGLTWEQMAVLFNVSRRSIHFWASGQPLSSHNEENLNRLLVTIKYINRGSASTNRSLLLSYTEDGSRYLDLLACGKYEEVKQILGPGNTPPRPQPKPLSPDAIASRMPQKPEELVNALQDPIHHEVGESRFVRAVRVRKSDSKQ